MKSTILAVSILALIGLAGGCRAASEGVAVFTGAEGVTAVITPIDANLGQYRRFDVAEFQDETALGVPPVVRQTLPGYVAEQLAEKSIPNAPTGKTLRIVGTYLYYEDAKTVTKQVFGPYEELLARVQFIDVDSGRKIGEAYAVGRSKTSVASGANKKAEGLAKAIVSLIEARYPER